MAGLAAVTCLVLSVLRRSRGRWHPSAALAPSPHRHARLRARASIRCGENRMGSRVRGSDEMYVGSRVHPSDEMDRVRRILSRNMTHVMVSRGQVW